MQIVERSRCREPEGKMRRAGKELLNYHFTTTFALRRNEFLRFSSNRIRAYFVKSQTIK
jgi:hypothetical protein